MVGSQAKQVGRPSLPSKIIKEIKDYRLSGMSYNQILGKLPYIGRSTIAKYCRAV